MSTDLAVEGVTWDLSDLYPSPQAPALEADLESALRRAEAFAGRYRGTINVPGGPEPAWMAAALTEVESIGELAAKPSVYAELLHAGDSRPAAHGALVARTQEQSSAVLNRLVFFQLEWLALDDEAAGRILEAPECARYRHYLAHARGYRPHMLSEPEEQLLEETANTGPRALSRLFDELVASLDFEVAVDGERKRLNESGVLALLHDARREVRRSAAAALTEKLREQRLVLTFVFNVMTQHHALTDRLRRFPDPMAARHLANEIDAPTVAALLGACEAHNAMVADYYRVKRRLLGLDTLYDYDRYAPVVEHDQRWSWPEARVLVLTAYERFSPRLREIAELFFARRWIDAEARDGKRGGAFSSSAVPSVHPYVLLNYLGTYRDVSTLAHELGHGVHQYLARDRGYLQCDTPLTMAETASVFGELLVFDELRRQVRDPRARLAFLCNFIEDAFGTVFRQVVLTRFEQELHAERRGRGELSSDEIGAIWQRVNRDMYGDAVTLTDDYRWWWAYIPHFIHTPFYCYAYSFGQLLVLALFELYRQRGASFVPDYLALLAAGGSEAPAELLRRLGLDVQEASLWELGLRTLRGMVDEAQQLAAQVQA
jgi:oligoendopeptidase F